MQGRVVGLMGSMYSRCYSVGMVIFEPMADKVPLQGIMVESGIILVLVAVSVFIAYQIQYMR